MPLNRSAVKLGDFSGTQLHAVSVSESGIPPVGSGSAGMLLTVQPTLQSGPDRSFLQADCFERVDLVYGFNRSSECTDLIQIAGCYTNTS